MLAIFKIGAKVSFLALVKNFDIVRIIRKFAIKRTCKGILCFSRYKAEEAVAVC